MKPISESQRAYRGGAGPHHGGVREPRQSSRQGVRLAVHPGDTETAETVEGARERRTGGQCAPASACALGEVVAVVVVLRRVELLLSFRSIPGRSERPQTHRWIVPATHTRTLSSAVWILSLKYANLSLDGSIMTAACLPSSRHLATRTRALRWRGRQQTWYGAPSAKYE